MFGERGGDLTAIQRNTIRILRNINNVQVTHSLSFLAAPTLEHRASVKHFVSLKFLNLRQLVVLLGQRIILSQGRNVHKHRINADKHPCLEWDSNP
jgi:hypothetical protein